MIRIDPLERILRNNNFDLSIDALCKSIRHHTWHQYKERFYAYKDGEIKKVLGVLYKDSVWDVAKVLYTCKSNIIYNVSIEHPCIYDFHKPFSWEYDGNKDLPKDISMILLEVLYNKYKDSSEYNRMDLTKGVGRVVYKKIVDREEYQIAISFNKAYESYNSYYQSAEKKDRCNIRINITNLDVQKNVKLEEEQLKQEQEAERIRQEEEKKRREEEARRRAEEARRKAEEAKRQADIKYRKDLSSLL